MAATTHIHLPAETLLDRIMGGVAVVGAAVDQALAAHAALNAIAHETDAALAERGVTRADAIRSVAARCF